MDPNLRSAPDHRGGEVGSVLRAWGQPYEKCWKQNKLYHTTRLKQHLKTVLLAYVS
jgi:hypothetical protein